MAGLRAWIFSNACSRGEEALCSFGFWGVSHHLELGHRNSSLASVENISFSFQILQRIAIQREVQVLNLFGRIPAFLEFRDEAA